MNKLKKILLSIILVCIFCVSCENPEQTITSPNKPKKEPETPVIEKKTDLCIKGIVAIEGSESSAGVQIQLKPEGKNTGTTVITSEDGTFVFDNLTEGKYRIDASKTAYISESVEEFELTGYRDNIQIALKPIPGTVTVYNFEGVILKSVYTKTGNPMYAKDAVVQLIYNGINYGNAVLSVSGGTFSVANVKEGTYSIYISLDGFDDAYFTDINIPFNVSAYGKPKFVIVKKSETITDTDQNNSPIVTKYTVSGVISLQEGGYAEGARVQLMRVDALYGLSVTTNSSGMFTIYNAVNSEDYRICVTLNGYITSKSNYFVLKDANLKNVNWSIVKKYEIGDRGPAGGWIIFEGGEYERDEGWTYIELAPDDINKKAIYGNYLNPVVHYGEGRSQMNTNYILNEHAKSLGGDLVLKDDVAAVLCSDYIYGGYNDWVLPTSAVFTIIINNNKNYANYNFKLTEQYWCSDTVYYSSDDVKFLAIRKFRFSPRLKSSSYEGDINLADSNFVCTENYRLRYNVRPVRYF
ncbi:hypothetical protein FACS1894102_3150 [Spirochaetia bacterium]|nr:hypothetical protein FACS1894102_3150 [Spirochaetia bacterium]